MEIFLNLDMISDKYFLQIFKTSPTPAAILFADKPDYNVLSCNDAFLSEISEHGNPVSFPSHIILPSV